MTDIRAGGFKSKRELDEYLSELDDDRPSGAMRISVDGDRVETIQRELARLQQDIANLRQQYATRSPSYDLGRKRYLLAMAITVFAGLAFLAGRRI